MELGVTITAMSLEAKVGQMLFLGLPRNSVTANTVVLGQFRPGGMILFTRDISTTMAQTLIDLNTYRQTAEACPPMFVGIDQKGGRVSRLPAAWATKFPTAAKVGRNSCWTASVRWPYRLCLREPTC
ncbi:MAG: glycoside hydrolase family 3 N-terminal domain-containing protein [Bacillota bacterium]|nr:glycoside hydrolase family 3 N-terminal domain-containing protein [Bacillota bacterium]